ncbi:hypothetical protein BKA64DRAFT_654076, partial [Cadophora sp. MPI-SDFR-AT-0126]
MVPIFVSISITILGTYGIKCSYLLCMQFFPDDDGYNAKRLPTLSQSRIEQMPTLSSLTMGYCVFPFTASNETQELLRSAAFQKTESAESDECDEVPVRYSNSCFY